MFLFSAGNPENCPADLNALLEQIQPVLRLLNKRPADERHIAATEEEEEAIIRRPRAPLATRETPAAFGTTTSGVEVAAEDILIPFITPDPISAAEEGYRTRPCSGLPSASPPESVAVADPRRKRRGNSLDEVLTSSSRNIKQDRRSAEPGAHYIP